MVFTQGLSPHQDELVCLGLGSFFSAKRTDPFHVMKGGRA